MFTNITLSQNPLCRANRATAVANVLALLYIPSARRTMFSKGITRCCTVAIARLSLKMLERHRDACWSSATDICSKILPI